MKRIFLIITLGLIGVFLVSLFVWSGVLIGIKKGESELQKLISYPELTLAGEIKEIGEKKLVIISEKDKKEIELAIGEDLQIFEFTFLPLEEITLGEEIFEAKEVDLHKVKIGQKVRVILGLTETGKLKAKIIHLYITER